MTTATTTEGDGRPGDMMTQPTPVNANGVLQPTAGDTDSLAVPAKRKRDNDDEDEVGDEDGDVLMDEADKGEEEVDEAEAEDAEDEDEKEMEEETEQKPSTPSESTKQLIKNFFEVLTSLDVDPPILKRPLPKSESHREPQAKRQKSVEPPGMKSISDKIADNAYSSIDDVAADVVSVVKASLTELGAQSPGHNNTARESKRQAAQLSKFGDQALELLRREKAYPKTRPEPASGQIDSHTTSEQGRLVLSLVGYAPQERRLFSSLPLSRDVDLSEANLPPGISYTTIVPSDFQEQTQTLGELFAPPRTLLPLQPPKQPKTQAKSNKLDFYQPHPTDSARFRNSTYFTTKLSTGYFLDYSNATPSWQTKPKHRERAQSLAGKKPSTSELEASEVDSLFRGAFSSFAPCKDDSAAVVPANVAGKMWWQQVGQRHFQRMIEVEYYGDTDDTSPLTDSQLNEINEDALQEALDSWDDSAIDPSLEDVMGARRDDQDKEADEILDEVTDLIETLASYQRIRNLSLPNSQNRPTSDPVVGDMLANAGPQPSEEEQATYHMLKAQLALIVKTLPPFAVAKLNGDQLDELLVSTKIMIQTDEYKGTMEEDEAGVQARIKAQQQAAQAAQAAQANARPSPQAQSVSSVPYPQQYQAHNQYGTPSRTPSQHQQYYRNAGTPSYQQQRPGGPPVPQQVPHTPRAQPNQYTRTNGYPNQYATQLAKAQTPYGHQSMPQYAAQQRPPPYGQAPLPGTPGARLPYHQQQQQQQQQQQGFPQQQSTPTQGNYGSYTNGRAALPQRTMSPQVGQRQTYSPAPNVQQQSQRYGGPNQNLTTQINRLQTGPGQAGTTQSQSPSLVGYHTVIPEPQQQRILEQAKARLAAQERSAAMLTQPVIAGLAGLSYSSTLDANRLAAARAGLANQTTTTTKPQAPTGQKPGVNGGSGTAHIPHRVTPVPVPIPAIPGSQRKPAS